MSTQMHIISKAALQSYFIPVQQTDVLQRQCACGQHTTTGSECEECHQKREGILQRAAVNSVPTNAVPPIMHDVLNSPGQPLDAGTRAFMEPRFGYDFSGVRVHTDLRAAESAQLVNALAYTVGRNVVFGTGQYAPGTSEGQQLLAHELVHTIQQYKSGYNGAYQAIQIGNVDDAYEQSAKVVARQQLEMSPMGPTRHYMTKPLVSNDVMADSTVTSNLLLQRTCAQNSSEAFYKTAPNYCKDTGFTGLLHSGDRCYREVPKRSRYFDCPPGDQVCFNVNGCYDSWDKVSPVEMKNQDGTCNLHGYCSIGHAAKDVLPEMGKGPGEAHSEVRLSLPFIEPTTGKGQPGLEAQYRGFHIPSLLGKHLQPFYGATLGTQGLGLQTGLTAEKLTGIGLYLEGRGALRTEWFQRIEVGGGVEVGIVLNKSRSFRLGISWDIWQLLTEDKRRNVLASALGFRF